MSLKDFGHARREYTKAELSRQKLELDIVRGKLNTHLVELQQDIKILERAMGLLDEEELQGILKQEVERIKHKVYPPPFDYDKLMGEPSIKQGIK